MNLATIRDEAFVEIPRPLWYDASGRGPMVVPLTWERYHHMLGERNPIVTGAPVDRRALRRALWQLSPGWQPTRANWLRFRVSNFLTSPLLKTSKLVAQLRYELRAAFAESQAISAQPKGTTPAAPQADELPPVHLLGQIIHTLGTLYGWTRHESLRCPIAVTYQLFIAAQGSQPRTNGVPQFSAADRSNGERLRKKREELRNRLNKN